MADELPYSMSGVACKDCGYDTSRCICSPIHFREMDFDEIDFDAGDKIPVRYNSFANGCNSGKKRAILGRANGHLMLNACWKRSNRKARKQWSWHKPEPCTLRTFGDEASATFARKELENEIEMRTWEEIRECEFDYEEETYDVLADEGAYSERDYWYLEHLDERYICGAWNHLGERDQWCHVCAREGSLCVCEIPHWRRGSSMIDDLDLDYDDESQDDDRRDDENDSRDDEWNDVSDILDDEEDYVLKPVRFAAPSRPHTDRISTRDFELWMKDAFAEAEKNGDMYQTRREWYDEFLSLLEQKHEPVLSRKQTHFVRPDRAFNHKTFTGHFHKENSWKKSNVRAANQWQRHEHRVSECESVWAQKEFDERLRSIQMRKDLEKEIAGRMKMEEVLYRLRSRGGYQAVHERNFYLERLAA